MEEYLGNHDLRTCCRWIFTYGVVLNLWCILTTHRTLNDEKENLLQRLQHWNYKITQFENVRSNLMGRAQLCMTWTLLLTIFKLNKIGGKWTFCVLAYERLETFTNVGRDNNEIRRVVSWSCARVLDKRSKPFPSETKLRVKKFHSTFFIQFFM